MLRGREAKSPTRLQTTTITPKPPNPPQEKFTGRYEASEAAVTAQLRDLPPVAGKVLWARQIERELRRLVKRVEDVLGPG